MLSNLAYYNNGKYKTKCYHGNEGSISNLTLYKKTFIGYIEVDCKGLTISNYINKNNLIKDIDFYNQNSKDVDYKNKMVLIYNLFIIMIGIFIFYKILN
jgi:hypothetical protein